MANFPSGFFLFALTLFTICAVGFSSAEDGSLCRFVLNDSSGQFTSPGYPGDYPNEAVCTWEIQAPAAKRIRLRFTEFHLEASSGCTNDYLEIFDGGEFETYCRKDAPPETESKGNTISVVLLTDELINIGGKFAAEYETFGEDLGDCSASLDLSMPTTWAFMRSPRHPDQYPNNYKCRYDILWQRTGENLDRFSHVAFLRFKTAGVAINGTGDILKVYRDGEEDKEHVLGGNYQHALGGYVSNLPHMSVSSVANLSLAFSSDSQNSDTGFLFAVTTELNKRYPKAGEKKGKSRMKKRMKPINRKLDSLDDEPKDIIHINMAEKTIYSSNSKFRNLAGFGSPHDPKGSQDVYDYGYFMSPNHPDDYEPNTDVWFNITAPPGQKVAIALLRLAMEAGAGGYNDFLGFRDGADENGWTWFSGSQRKMSYVWTTEQYNYAISRFYSDYMVQYSGFLAAFAAVDIDWSI